MRAILDGRDRRLMLIIGPCSADREDSVMDYIHRLVPVQDEVKDKLLIVPRVYTNKPRTNGAGYKGMLHQPDPSKSRTCWLALSPSAVSIPGWWEEDPVSPVPTRCSTPRTTATCPTSWAMWPWVPLGGEPAAPPGGQRTGRPRGYEESHRRRPERDDELHLCRHGRPHSFSIAGWEVETYGTPTAQCHPARLRKRPGESRPNYHYEDLVQLYKLYTERAIKNPACIVDCNHANSGKQYLEQTRIAKEVMHSKRYSADINALVKGLMIESYIEDGNQKITECTYGKSITDACLGWEKTRQLIFDLAELL